MLECKLVGITFKNEGIKRSDICNTLKEGQVVDLNSTTAKWIDKKTGKPMEDKHAVEVLCDGQVCGMIPASINQKVHGKAEQARVIRFTRKDALGFTDDEDAPIVSVTVEIDIDVAKPIAEAGEEPTHQECTKVMSFNENIPINYYERPYGGFWYNGKRLHGVTREIDTMYKPFDSAKVAGFCSRHWNMPAEDIQDMWSTSGNISNQFGKSIHSGLENYDKYGERGLPKMPIIRDIITACPLTQDDEVLVEVLITDVANGISGFIDRLVRNGDVYQVQDHKINIDADVVDKKKHANLVMPELPANKISHYVCQESYYSELLARTLKVADDVLSYVFDGTWEIYKEPRIVDVIERIEAHKKENS